MLLNEFLKEHRKVEELKKDFQATVAQQQKEIQALTARLEEQAAQIQKVSAELEVNKLPRKSFSTISKTEDYRADNPRRRQGAGATDSEEEVSDSSSAYKNLWASSAKRSNG